MCEVINKVNYKALYMRLDDLVEHLSKNILDSIKRTGISELNDPQIKSVRAGLFNRKNMVVAAPTASGKTLIAELAALHTIFASGRKAIYVVPLRAIGSEKYREFREKYESAGLKIALSMGDYDSEDNWLREYDFIIVTSEKLDSLMRHGAEWIKDSGLVVLDEIHLLNDVNRGSTLEMVITKLRLSYPHLRFVALSATISNADEIAEWLNAELIVSDFRPVPVRKGIFFNEAIDFIDGNRIEMVGCKDALDFVLWMVNRRKQVLCFVNSRRNAESMAEKLSRLMLLKEDERRYLEILAKNVLSVLDTPTEQCKRLASCIKQGVAFHHAGLIQRQRELVEDNFRKGFIKALIATPTLAAGVNLPASVVLVRDLKRYEAGYGMKYIPVLEFEQMAGRSGRPRYDKEGIAVAVAKSKEEAEFTLDHYLRGLPEPVYSKLGVEPLLRTHLLGIIASVPYIRMSDVLRFMEHTFYAYQYKDLKRIKGKVRRIVSLLEEYGLIKSGSEGTDFITADKLNEDIVLRATRLGRRTSELYIDPRTAHLFIDALKNADGTKYEPLSFLHLACLAREAQPLPRVKKQLEDRVVYSIEERKQWLLIKPPELWSYEYSDFVVAMAGAMLLEDWMNEKKEDYVLGTYNMAPGDLRVFVENINWLLYSMGELGKILGCSSTLLNEIRKTRMRILHGVREELLELVQLRGIGRARARKLWNVGIRSIADIRNASIEMLESMLGKKTAKNVLEQLSDQK